MAEKSLFEELKDALQALKDFLTPEIKAVLKPAIQALAALIPDIIGVLEQLRDLLGQLRDEIDKLDPGQVPGLDEVTTFTEKTKEALEAARNLLTGEAEAINTVIGAIDVVTGLPSLDEVKQLLLDLLDDLQGDIDDLIKE